MRTITFLKNHLFLLSLLTISLLFMTGIGEASKLKVRVIVQKANVRLKPDINSPVIAKAPIGTVLESVGKEGRWYKINLPPDESGFVVSGYIHENIVEVLEEIKEVLKKEKVEEEKQPEITPPAVREPPVKEEKPPPIKPRYTPRRRERRAPQRAFSFKSGLGIAFPSGDWSDLFTLGLGVNLSGIYSILQQPKLDLVGGLEGFYFLRESGYVDVSMSRILLYGDCRFSKKINNFGFFAEGGLGLYLDILEVEVGWWTTTESEFEIGARLGGGVTFGRFEIMAMYHLLIPA